MTALLITILGHLCYGTTNVMWKNPRNEMGTLPLIITRSFFSFLIFLFSFIALTNLGLLTAPKITFRDLLSTAGICAVNYFGLFFYLKSLKHAPVSSTIGFGKVSLIIGVLSAYFLYDEEISALKIGMCIIVLIGVTFIERAARIGSEVMSKGLMYSILCKLFWGTSYLFVPFIDKLGPILFCVVLEFIVCTLSCLLLLASRSKFPSHTVSRRTKFEIGILVVLGTGGTFCLNFALANISILLFATLALIEPILGLIISKIYHRERLTPLQYAGVWMGIAAAFVLGVLK
ncbi:DMT family transporter [Kaistella sp. PBT33-4]|uniref:DMT family transporter n=1 Tax=Kaistella sp. PBT33-4 TaxID=3032000 RepID=UPI0023D7F838|nr:DMT family transporter [Kaistella sp. PBT33-4]MDF0720544.1 DMT family transporter [Kaistella sp. PBT33-4]